MVSVYLMQVNVNWWILNKCEAHEPRVSDKVSGYHWYEYNTL